MPPLKHCRSLHERRRCQRGRPEASRSCRRGGCWGGEGGAHGREGSLEGAAATGPSRGHSQGPGQRDTLQDTGSHSDFRALESSYRPRAGEQSRKPALTVPWPKGKSGDVPGGSGLIRRKGRQRPWGTHCPAPGTDIVRWAQTPSCAHLSSGCSETLHTPVPGTPAQACAEAQLWPMSTPPAQHTRLAEAWRARLRAGRVWGSKRDVPACICVPWGPHALQPRKGVAQRVTPWGPVGPRAALHGQEQTLKLLLGGRWRSGGRQRVPRGEGLSGLSPALGRAPQTQHSGPSALGPTQRGPTRWGGW